MPPVNDLLSGAIDVDLSAAPLDITGTTVDATDTGDTFEAGGTRIYTGPSVWYHFEPSSDLDLTLDMTAESYDMGDDAYAELFISSTGSATSTGTDLEQPPAPGNWYVYPGEPETTIPLFAGEHYYLYVGSVAQVGASGTFTIHVTTADTTPAPDNDGAAGAFEVERCETVEVTTAGGTETDEESDIGVQGPSVWFRFTPSISETLMVKLISASGFGGEGADIRVFSGPHVFTDYDDLVSVAFIGGGDPGEFNAADIAFDPAFTYYIAVYPHNQENVTGTATFTICDPPEHDVVSSDTCADARTLLGTSGSILSDNANAEWESPDRIFKYSKGNSLPASVGGKSVWFKHTATIDCRLQIGIDTDPGYQGWTGEDGYSIGIFRDCSTCVQRFDSLDETNPRFQIPPGQDNVFDVVEQPFTDLHPFGLNPAAGIGMRKGETVYIEVDVLVDSNTTEPPATTPGGGRFRLLWDTFPAGFTDKPKDNCGAPDPFDIPPDGNPDHDRHDCLDYCETTNGDRWRLHSRDDVDMGGAVPVITKWNGSGLTAYELDVSDLGEDFLSWCLDDDYYSLDTDGELIWVSVYEKVLVENPYFCGDFADSPIWAPLRLAVFQSSGGEFSRVGTVEAETFNDGHSTFGDVVGALSPIACTASPGQPGVVWINWAESGHMGFHIFDDDSTCDNLYGNRWYMCAFGPNAPIDSKTVLAESDISDHTELPDPPPFGFSDPYHLGFWEPLVSPAVQLVNDTGTPFMFRVRVGLDPDQSGESTVHAVFKQPYLDIYRIETDGDITLLQTIGWTPPTDDYPASVDPDDIFNKVDNFMVEERSHVDPFDGRRIRYVVIRWVIRSGDDSFVGLNVVYRVRANGAAVGFFDGDKTGERSVIPVDTITPGTAGDITRMLKLLWTDRYNQLWVMGSSTSKLAFFDRKCHTGWAQWPVPRAYNPIDLVYQWDRQLPTGRKWVFDEAGGHVIIGLPSGGGVPPGSSGSGPKDPPVTIESIIDSPGLLTDSNTPGNLASMVAHGYEWLSYQVYNRGDVFERNLQPARDAGFRNVGVWGVIECQEFDDDATKAAIFFANGKAFAQQAIKVGADHVMVDSELGYKHTRPSLLGRFIIAGMRAGGWQGPVHLTPLGTPSDPVAFDFEYDHQSFIDTGGGIFPQAYANDDASLAPVHCHTYWTRFVPERKINYMIGLYSGTLGKIVGADWVPLLQAAEVFRNFCIFLAENADETDFAGLDALTLEDAPPTTGPGGVDHPGPETEIIDGVSTSVTGRTMVRFGGTASPIASAVDEVLRRARGTVSGAGDPRRGPHFGIFEIDRNRAMCSVSDIPFEPEENETDTSVIVFIETLHRAEASTESPGTEAAEVHFSDVRFLAEPSSAEPGEGGAAVHFSGIRFRA